MWYQLETVRRGRWWFFWNFVLLGRGLRFSIFSTQEGGVKIDALDPNGGTLDIVR